MAKPRHCRSITPGPIDIPDVRVAVLGLSIRRLMEVKNAIDGLQGQLTIGDGGEVTTVTQNAAN